MLFRSIGDPVSPQSIKMKKFQLIKNLKIKIIRSHYFNFKFLYFKNCFTCYFTHDYKFFHWDRKCAPNGISYLISCRRWYLNFYSFDGWYSTEFLAKSFANRGLKVEFYAILYNTRVHSLFLIYTCIYWRRWEQKSITKNWACKWNIMVMFHFYNQCFSFSIYSGRVLCFIRQ